jgi:hypothetical protein
MRKLNFNDGLEFDLDGELRAVKRNDGWYVLGEGILIPVGSYQEALEEIERIRDNDDD